YRVPVILCDLEGKTRREVARQLQVPEGTLSGRLTTAHRLLAKRLRRRGITLSGAALAAALAQQAAAAVPAHVISGTITVVASLAAGRTPACAVSAKVAMLASGVLRAMFIKKLSRVAVLVLIFCGFAVGAGASYWRTAAHVPGAESTAPITNNGVRRRVVDQRPTKAEKRKPRILLLAGAPGREYQFLHALFRREAQENLCEFAVYLQTADKKKGADQFDSFDVIIALDPNWAAIQKEKLDSLPKWVKEHGGGLVFVAGAVHTPQLAIPAFDADLSKTKAMCPVTLKDGRLHFDKMEHDASRPYALEFSKAARKFGFLKLDQGEDPLAGWNKFFWKDEKKPNGDAIPVRGFHTYYPVEKLRPTATVLASFVGPAASRIGDGKIPQPFIVYQRYGRGATLYIGASEMWRLRAFSETYYDHFWTQLAHFMTAVKQSGK
ncbi:MAG TPA: hypothetical protein VKE98_05545, partial [Gemmataceae bacterium]|nr:hypothetical protein [Gemmataceae bacterium]